MPIAQERQPGDRIAFGFLVAFAVLMYAIPSEWIDGLGALRLALVTSSAAAGLLLLRRLFRFEPIYLDGIRGAALIAFVTLTVLSLTWSAYPDGTQFASAEMIKALAIYLTMVNVITTQRRLVIFCGALVLASVFASIGAINYWRAGVHLVEGFRTRWVGVFADPNYLAMLVGMIVPLAVAFVTRREQGWLFRIACAISGVLAIIAIVLTHSRGGFLGLMAAMAMWSFREKRRLQAIVLGTALVIGLLVFAPDTFWRRSQTIGQFQADPSAMGRVHAWEAAANMSKAHPLLGVGAGAFLYVWPLYRPAAEKTAHVAHNVFLDVVGELGFVGLLLFLMFVGAAAGGAFAASRNPELAWLARAIAASLVGYLTSSLFLSGYTLSSHLYVLCGIAACAERISRRAAEPVRQRWRPPVVSFPQGVRS